MHAKNSTAGTITPTKEDLVKQILSPSPEKSALAFCYPELINQVYYKAAQALRDEIEEQHLASKGGVQ